MYISLINNINFTANKYTKSKPIDPKVLRFIKNNANTDIRQGLYNDIDMFVKKEISKNEYLEKVNTFIKKIDHKTPLNDAEKQYIGDMMATMDMSPKDKIPEKYIIKNINELLNNQ